MDVFTASKLERRIVLHLHKLGTLADLMPMERGLIVEINDLFEDWDYPDQAIDGSRLRPGAMVQMVTKLPAEGPLMVIIDGEEFNIFPEVASSIFIKRIV